MLTLKTLRLKLIFKLFLLFISFTAFSLALNPTITNEAADLKEEIIQKPTSHRDMVGMANPAAVYCKYLDDKYLDDKYTYEIVTSPSGSQTGFCKLPDGESCDAWEFLNGKCGEKYSYCVREGYNLEIRTDGRNSFSREYAVCVSQDGKEIVSVAELTNLTEKSTKVKRPPKDKIKTAPPESQSEKNDQSNSSHQATSFDWRDYNGNDYVTPVKDQGNCGSCWAFSAVGVTEGDYNVVLNNPDYDLNLAEEYLVSNCYTDYNCCGGWEDEALDFIVSDGIPDEDCMSYVDADTCTCIWSCDSNCTYRTGDHCSDATCTDRCVDYASRLVSADAKGTVADIGITADRADIKSYLAQKGPLTVALEMGARYWDGDIVRCSGATYADHAVTLVGYYDTGSVSTSYWIIKNSWGDTWGESGDGYFKLGYDECVMEESGIFYADLSSQETRYFYVQNSSGTDKASVDTSGNMILAGTCTAGGICDPPDESFIIQNSAGGPVGYIDSSGNLCVETGDCTDESANCDSPTGDAFIITDSSDNNVFYIDQNGDLCLTGTLTESGSP